MARLGPGLRVCHGAGLGSAGEGPSSQLTVAVVGKSPRLAGRWIRVFISHWLLVEGHPSCSSFRALSSSKKANEKSQGMLARQKSVFCNCISKETVPPLLLSVSHKSPALEGSITQGGSTTSQGPPGTIAIVQGCLSHPA